MKHTFEQLQLGELAGATHIKMACGLTEFPQELLLLADTLEILDLSGNQLTCLPEDFGKLVQLKILFLSNNLFTQFPAVVAQCLNLEIIGFKANQIETMAENSLPLHLRWLILTDNRLQQLPASIGQCYRLEKLMLAGNQLIQLPPQLVNCTRLGLLRISANRLTFFPNWLAQMPQLGWLAFAGNPFSYQSAAVVLLQQIDWQRLTITHQLGQGASGVISKAVWQQTENDTQEVAVKVFKGEVTSDGLPEDEMQACLLAGEHPNLVQLLGNITNHPLGKQGLVLELMPTDFTNLAHPPSFDTCTRDVYANDTQFLVQTIVQIVQPVAAIAAQLHAKGIMHGDLYAHNILTNTANKPLFSDFGAASLYNPEIDENAAAFERIEVRAFGCLLDDLLRYVVQNPIDKTTIAALQALKAACLQPNVLERPSFNNIIAVLKKLA